MILCQYYVSPNLSQERQHHLTRYGFDTLHAAQAHPGWHSEENKKGPGSSKEKAGALRAVQRHTLVSGSGTETSSSSTSTWNTSAKANR